MAGAMPSPALLPSGQTLTLNTTTAFLAGVAVVQALASSRADSHRPARANAIGAAVCAIAFLHYSWMREAGDEEERTRLRYGDWVVTCPLLLLELQEMARVSESARAFPLAGVVAMVGFGYAAARARGALRHLLFSVSSLVLAAVVHSTLSHAKERKWLVASFFSLWAAYPVAFLVGKDAAFDVLDAASKGAFGLYVALWRNAEDGF